MNIKFSLGVTYVSSKYCGAYHTNEETATKIARAIRMND